jgi:N-acetylmuramoyl-L-alanine amidase
MITLAWYLLKVIICSGILCGYYYIALRNKIFHRWNRFFLLAAVVLALLVPLMKINIFQKSDADKGTVIRMLQTINYGDEIVIEYSRNKGLQFNSENIIAGTNLLISIILITIFFLALYKIYRLKKKYPGTKIKEINFISTDAKGTPFSFFNSIFWNNAIDLHSKPGQQIFNHEIAHVKEKHSYDKIFMNVVILFLWINPFFWLMRKELSMIHEFIADKEALEDNDISAFAEMVLQTVYPGSQFTLTNNFFHSPLKRRIIMFTKNKNPKVNYVSRILVLPLAAIVFFAFTLKMKTINPTNHFADKSITVVIDAGHGGSDNGAMENNINEKDLTLAIAKEIQVLNKDKNLHIILSRTGDEQISPRDRINLSIEKKADLFISIHIDVDANRKELSGLAIVIPQNGNPYLKESQLLGSAIIQSFQNNYPLPVSNDLKQLQKGVWILKANECPSVLIETGFLSNQKDVDYLINPTNQKTIAQNILNGIEKYTENNSVVNEITSDSIPGMYYKNKKVDSINGMKGASKIRLTFADGSHLIITNEEALKNGLELPPPPPVSIPKNALYVIDGKISSSENFNKIDGSEIKSVTVLKGEAAIKKYGEKGKNGVIEIIKKNGEATDVIMIKETPDTDTNPVYFVDGKETSKDEMKKLSPNSIESINVFKGESAINKFGKKGKNGVVEIFLKPTEIIQKDTIPNKVFTKVENEAEFPGGKEAWLKYITSQIEKNQVQFTDKDFGTCVVKFIVNTDGSVSNIEATTMEKSLLAKVSVDAIRTGPKWIPATQNGNIVTSYRLQPVTLTNPSK